ncbi:hypothetical protein C8N24_4144 [Solirubrobacter pauli]|uniref:Uncharacterized protein n=1 Tax=Solirubrobacter pauli TaxID=166793 RepID=A0A660KYW4_9ACTN|nr:hypothetical protein [Solirubrobacter pauli]RKQ86134.1 hypothetical protein C8N24_4144 [Solirubrobacter pauli]
MNTKPRFTVKPRHLAAVALAVLAVPFAAGTASAAPVKGKRATWTKAATTSPATAATTPAPTTSAATVTSVHAIGGYVFYNVTYLEAVELWAAAVAAAPAGYTPPPVYSVSATTTVSGTVPGTDGR